MIKKFYESPECEIESFVGKKVFCTGEEEVSGLDNGSDVVNPDTGFEF